MTKDKKTFRYTFTADSYTTPPRMKGVDVKTSGKGKCKNYTCSSNNQRTLKKFKRSMTGWEWVDIEKK